MDKKKWAKERDEVLLTLKLGEETAEVLKAHSKLLRGEGPVEDILEELDHVIFIAERFKAVLEI